MSLRKWRTPHLARWSWGQYVQGSSIALDDPTIRGADIVGGWFHGTVDAWGIEAAARLVTEIASQQSIPSSRILLYGSSIGGFAALYLAARLPGALAMAEVPQTDLRIYPDIRFIREMTTHVYQSVDLPVLAARFPYRFSVLEYWRSRKSIPRCHIIHELSDKAFGNSQFSPFLSALQAEEPWKYSYERMTIEILNRGQGHAALPIDDALPRIQRALMEL